MNIPVQPITSRRMREEEPERFEEIATPSRITPLHVCDRETSKVAGTPRAWRKLSELELAYQQERLGKRDSNEARDRLAAGNQYTKLWDVSRGAGRDSTLAFDFRGGGQRLPLTEAQQASLSRLVAIETRLGKNDRMIVRGVCALGQSPAEAIAGVRLARDTRVTGRFCEALDALIDAIECTERRGRK